MSTFFTWISYADDCRLAARDVLNKEIDGVGAVFYCRQMQRQAVQTIELLEKCLDYAVKAEMEAVRGDEYERWVDT
jgi:hypothetical protein